MMEREAICPCFHRVLLYTAIAHNRIELLALLLTDEESKIWCEVNSLSVCEYVCNTVLKVLEKGHIQAFLGEDSILPTESVALLYEMLCKDIQWAAKYFYVLNNIDDFTLLVSRHVELEKRR